MRILAVDDDPLILELLPIVLSQAGYDDVSVADSGKAALEMLDCGDDHFDCLLLDIMMPGMTGTELCRHVRALDDYCDTPVIMLTANRDGVSVESAFAAGANDYIAKPFDVNDIANRITVAERMARQYRNLFRIDPTARQSEGSPGQHHFGFGDCLHVTNARQHTDLFSLGNYLSQLAIQRIASTCVFAIEIDPMQSLYDDLTSEEFARALAEVSRSLSEVLGSSGMLSSYSGAGVFLCICDDRIIDTLPAVEGLLKEALSRSRYFGNFGELGDFRLTVGRPVKANASRTHRVKTTFDRAIATLKRRSNARHA